MQKRLIDLLSSEKTAERVAIAVFVVILALIAFGQVSYNDFFWHLALGKWMFATKSFLTHDIFSYTFQGKEWLNSTWLYDGALYFLYKAGSYQALNTLRLLIIGATYFFFIRIARLKYKAPLLLVLGLFLLTIPSMRNFYRPEIMQPLFIGYFLYALYRYKYFRSRIIYTLPLVEALWVNVHGSFQFGILLIAIFLGSELLRTLASSSRNVSRGVLKNQLIKVYAVMLVLTAAATLLNPYGYAIYARISEILADTESLWNVLEWKPTPIAYFFTFPQGGPFAFPLLVWAAVILLIRRIWKFARENANIRLIADFFYEDVLIFILFLMFAFRHLRFGSMLSLIAALLIVKCIPKPAVQKHAYTLMFCAALAFVLITNFRGLRINQGPSYFNQPQESARFLLEHRLSGNMLNDYVGGSELTWLLYPQYKIFIDGRTPNLYDNDFYWYYRNLADTNILSKVLERYAITFAALPNTSSLSESLSLNPEWALVFFDNFTSVYLRQTPENQTLIDRYRYTVLNPRKEDATYLQYCGVAQAKQQLLDEISRNLTEIDRPIYGMNIAATLLLECPGKTINDARKAEAVLMKAIQFKPDDPVLRYKLGVAQLDLDKNTEALRNFKIASSIQKTKKTWTGIGIALHNLGRYPEAEKIFKKVPFLAGDTPVEYYQIYGRVSYQLDNNEKAIDLFHRYDDLAGQDELAPQDYLDLSHAYSDAGDEKNADYYNGLASQLSASTTQKNP